MSRVLTLLFVLSILASSAAAQTTRCTTIGNITRCQPEPCIITVSTIVCR